jgi:hypothetical protein
MAYLSQRQIRDSLSDYQIYLLLLMRSGLYIVTNEGANFRAWVVNSDFQSVNLYKVRTNSLNILHTYGLMDHHEFHRNGIYAYKLSKLGMYILELVPKKEQIAKKYNIVFN